MIFRTTAACAALLALTACVVPEGTGTSTAAPSATTTVAGTSGTVQRFNRVVARTERVAEQVCRDRVRSGTNCDFRIVYVSDPRQPANAYQSEDASGRPVLTFTAALVEDTRNDDELAFVLGHEAAHHIRGHLTQTRQTATIGALAGGTLAVLLGGGQSAVDAGVNLGGTVGARAYSKDHELEADALGARIAHNAGYDPVKGAAFFQRIPDPGDRFLGSHPPNAQRIETVRRTAASF
ncbi:M48 family metalloprotease [Cognatishimia sp. SS12]|nr:M48 family metalloprotease [Cognatishimia sp. SS12]MDC0738158.1 M48 family metalloprotease [Cognatishimia sp. SS12]